MRLFFSIGIGDKETKILTDLAPLISRGHVIVTPNRGLIYLDEAGQDGSPNKWQMLDIEATSPFDHWYIGEEPRLIPMISGSNDGANQERKLATVIVPFIQGIPSEDLAKILDDERDVLDESRAAMRQLVSQSASDNTKSIVLDLIKPSINKIERRYKKIASMSRLKMAGAVVSAVSLSLISYHLGGLTASALALFGAGGASAVGKNILTGIDEIASFKNEPVYLLWRITRRH
jgi:hypothetical protein